MPKSAILQSQIRPTICLIQTRARAKSVLLPTSRHSVRTGRPATKVGWRRTWHIGEMFGARKPETGGTGGDQLSSSPSWRYALFGDDSASAGAALQPPILLAAARRTYTPMCTSVDAPIVDLVCVATEWWCACYGTLIISHPNRSPSTHTHVPVADRRPHFFQSLSASPNTALITSRGCCTRTSTRVPHPQHR